VPSRDEVTHLLDRGLSYAETGRRLGIGAGLAFMIATGVAADGSETDASAEAGGPDRPSSPQQLVNPPAHNPTTSAVVLRWVRTRAAADLPGA
jgi:hypothetical protein